MKENFQRKPKKLDRLPHNMSDLKQRITRLLYGQALETADAGTSASGAVPSSSVLVPLRTSLDDGSPHLILNKRSQQVRQPGDLCFPGGGSEVPMDDMIARALQLSGSPLTQWPYWQNWQRRSRQDGDDMALLLATGLRESLEEMNLNPFGVHFLGPLPAQQLVMFDRRIQPMAVWLDSEQHFRTNWEVARIITIPLRDLLDAQNYRTYQIVYSPEVAARLGKPSQEFPAFRFEDDDSVEILWGVTFRIVRSFLKLVFRYDMPPLDVLPTVEGTLGMEYYTGTS